MQKSYFAVRWAALLLALACAIGVPTALYAAEAKETVAEPGVVVVALDPDGPAAAAGVKRGDIILAVNGNPVNAIADLVTVLATMPAKTTLTLQVQHGDTVQTVTVTPTLREQRAYLGILPYAAPIPAAAPSGSPLPPVSPVAQPAPLQTLPPVPPLPNGTAQTVTITQSLVILEVMPGSVAAAVGLQPQDLITAVDGSAVAGPEALRAHLASLQPDDTITLTIARGDEAPRPVVIKVGKGTAGQALLGVKLGMVVTATEISAAEAQLAVPPAAAEFYQGRLFFHRALPVPGCMSDGGDRGQTAPQQDFVQRQPGTLMIAPLMSNQWVAQPALPADQNAVVIVQGQLDQGLTSMAEPVQQGMMIVSPAQAVTVPMQSVMPDSQGNVLIFNDQVMPAQPAAPAVPTVGDYY